MVSPWLHPWLHTPGCTPLAAHACPQSCCGVCGEPDASEAPPPSPPPHPTLPRAHPRVFTTTLHHTAPHCTILTPPHTHSSISRAHILTGWPRTHKTPRVGTHTLPQFHADLAGALAAPVSLAALSCGHPWPAPHREHAALSSVLAPSGCAPAELSAPTS